MFSARLTGPGPGSDPAQARLGCYAFPSREWPDSDSEGLPVASAATFEVTSLPAGEAGSSRGALDAGPRDWSWATALAKQRSASAGGRDMSGAKCTCRPRG